MIRLVTDLAVHGISCLWQVPVNSATTSSTTSNATSVEEENIVEIEMKRKCIIRRSAISLLSCLANAHGYKDMVISDCVCVLVTLAEDSHSNR